VPSLLQSSAAAAEVAADAAAVELEQAEPAPPWQACLSYAEGETVYDVDWYPGMSSAEPASCCFVSTARDHPVHLWCAYTGSLRGICYGTVNSTRTVAHTSMVSLIKTVAVAVGRFCQRAYTAVLYTSQRIYDCSELHQHS
jgi:hypothetical protein